ncbi:hypothetical protein D3C78_1582670 [compost metagenome]
MMTCTHEPTRSARKFCRPITVIAPRTGPAKVPMPPSRVIRITSPESDQCASDSVAKPSATVFREPAKPARAAERTKAISL